MDPRERIDDLREAVRAALDGRQAVLWTMLPGILQSFDPAAMTATVQVAIQIGLRGTDGVVVPTPLPLLVDCPVQFPSGGGFTLTFPLASGDEGMVHFASRCIDAWWQSGGVQPQAEFRMHDLSDGFFVPKVWSQPKKLNPAPSSATTQLRSDDGQVYVEIASGHVVNIVAPGGVNITGNISVTGAITATGNVTSGQGGADQVDMQNHIHGSVQTGTGTSGKPVAGS